MEGLLAAERAGVSNGQRALADLVSQRAELIRYHRQVLAELRAKRRELVAVRKELATVRKELRGLFPRLRRLGARGAPVFRHVIRSALASCPMLTTELTVLVMEARGRNPDDKAAYLADRKRVHACLKELRRNGEIVSVRAPGKPNAWTLA